MKQKTKDTTLVTPVTPFSESNPAASSRRRLIRALGGGGGLAIAAVVAYGWKKPIVTAVVLPAHARSSQTPATEECTVGYSITATNDNATMAYTLAIALNGATATEVPITGSDTLSVSAELTAPTLSFTRFFTFAETGANIAMSESITCCADIVTTPAAVNAGNATAIFFPSWVVTADEGVCTINYPSDGP